MGRGLAEAWVNLPLRIHSLIAAGIVFGTAALLGPVAASLPALLGFLAWLALMVVDWILNAYLKDYVQRRYRLRAGRCDLAAQEGAIIPEPVTPGAVRDLRIWSGTSGRPTLAPVESITGAGGAVMAATESLIPLAEIAGVFVGFGALIAVRSGGARGRIEIGYTRGMVAAGLLTIVAAMAPVTLGRYDLDDHQVWALSSVLILVGWVVFFAANARTPEYRANMTADYAASGSRWRLAANWAVTGSFMLAAVLPPILVVLGVATELEPALYSTAVVMALLMASSLLLALVYERRETAAA